MAKSQSDENPAISFLRTLYELTPGGYVELRAIANDKLSAPRRVFARTPVEINKFAAQFGHKASPFGVYFGICKREREDGTKKSIERVPCLWVDLDTVKNGWDTDAMVKRIHAISGALRPSACIRSGGGLHLYWYLDDPYELVSPSDHHLDAKEVESTNALLRDIFAGDAVQNIDRILRLPDTWNTKRKPAKRVEIAWNYGFDRKNYFAIQDAALHQKKWLGVDGEWGNKGVVLKNTRPVTADPMNTFADIYGEGSRRASKNMNDMWANRVRYTAPRGYIGIHEAALQHTAQLYMSNKDMPEAKVIEIVMSRIKEIKDRDAPDEQWDMKREEATVLQMYKTWQPKWHDYVNDQRRQAAAERKQSAKPISLRNADRRISGKSRGTGDAGPKLRRNAVHVPGRRVGSNER